jgi:hypothetical protein
MIMLRRLDKTYIEKMYIRYISILNFLSDSKQQFGHCLFFSWITKDVYGWGLVKIKTKMLWYIFYQFLHKIICFVSYEVYVLFYYLYRSFLFFYKCIQDSQHPAKTTDLSQVTDTLCHIMLYTSPWSRFELTTLVVICTDCKGSCKSNLLHLLKFGLV